MDDKKYVDCFTEIQHDWDISVVQGGNFWARCTFLNHTTASSEQRNSQQAAEEIIEHQHLTVGFEDDATFLVKEGKTRHSIQLECPRLVSNIHVYAPSAQFDPFQQSPIFSIDESPDGKYLVMGGESGNLKVYEKENQELVSDLVGHLGDVTLARFFPSSRVVLSGGADRTLRVWGLTGGPPAREFMGHRGSITGAAMIGRGRQVLSSSQDGTVKLWECVGGHCQHTWRVAGDRYRATALGLAALNNPNDEQDEWNWIVATCSDGSVVGCDLRSKEHIFKTLTGDRSSIDCCSVIPISGTALIAAGTENGHLYCWDVRNPGSPVVRVGVCQDEGVGVAAVGVPRGGGQQQESADTIGTLWAATTEGRIWEMEDIDGYTPKLKITLTGPYYKPINDMSLLMRVVENKSYGYDVVSIVSGCRDGIARIYEIPVM